MSLFRTLFRIDVLLNLFSGAWAMLAPRSFIGQFIPSDVPVHAEAAVPWFGVLCFVLGLVEWGLLEKGNKEALIAFMRGFLVGDLLYLWFFADFVRELGAWNLSSVLSMATTALFCLLRAYYLWSPGAIPTRLEDRS